MTQNLSIVSMFAQPLVTAEPVLEVIIDDSASFYNPLLLFSFGTILGATATYLIVRNRKRAKEERENSTEEEFEFPEKEDDTRLIMAVRNDINMHKGKVAAQCGHAAIAAYMKAKNLNPKILARWLKYGSTKITLQVDDEDELLELTKAAMSKDVLSCVVRDAGHTPALPGTRTIVAIGPASKKDLDEIIGHLQLY